MVDPILVSEDNSASLLSHGEFWSLGWHRRSARFQPLNVWSFSCWSLELWIGQKKAVSTGGRTAADAYPLPRPRACHRASVDDVGYRSSLGYQHHSTVRPSHFEPCFQRNHPCTGAHGVYTEISFGPHHLVAQVHAPHLCILQAHLVHGDPHSSHYAIEPPTGGHFCDELVDGEIVIRPHSPNDVAAEFRSPRMDWSGKFRRHTPGS